MENSLPNSCIPRYISREMPAETLAVPQASSAYKRRLCLYVRNRKKYIRLLKSLNVVNLSKRKIIANLPELMCVVVSGAQNGEFQRFRGFCVDCYYTGRGEQGWKAHFPPLQRQADFHPEFQIPD